MPIEYQHGLLLEPEDLDMIRAHIEESETIENHRPRDMRDCCAQLASPIVEAAA
jgi:hypothetical protein